MSFQWSASHRYRHPSAPGGLGLVQDFLNTVGISGYGPDLLGDTASAQTWADEAVRMWSIARGVDAAPGFDTEPPALSDADVVKLRALRATITQMVAGETSATPVIGAVSASFAVDETGEVRLEPAGTGWRWLASALWGEILLSQQADTWRRIKQCRKQGCESTFYDRSKNNSGVWCSAKTCGNSENLRASRARRREREGGQQPSVGGEVGV